MFLRFESPVRIVCIVSAALWAFLAGAQVVRGADLDQQVTAEFVWNAAVRGSQPIGVLLPPTYQTDPILIAPGEAPATTRVLGLTKLRWELDWHRHKQSGFFLVLRPDAALVRTSDDSSTKSQEFDSRSGSVYRPAPEVKLLDAYYLRGTLGGQLSGRIGVWESMAPVRSAYPVSADFSLRVRLPEKYYGTQLDWAVGSGGNPPSPGEVANKFAFKIIGFSQDGDRGETYGRAKSDSDRAPSVKNPNIGAAGSALWHASDVATIEGLAGIQTHSGSDSKIREAFANLVVVENFILLGHPGLVIGDMRHAQETWLDTPEDQLRQSSVGLTTSCGISDGIRVVSGLQYGRSERFLELTRDNLALHSGYQAEIGLRNQVRDGLDWGFLYVHETRSRSQKTSVLSEEAKDQTPGVTRRASVSLNYLIGTD